MIAFQRLASRALMSLLSATVATAAVQAQTAAPAPRPSTRTQTADYIVAIVNQELVTAGEVQQRIDRLREEAQRSKAKLPPDDELRRQVVDALIDERVQITNARDVGQRVDDMELERAVANVAAQNQLTPAQLRERLKKEGIDYTRFRNNVRDQLLVERVRERASRSPMPRSTGCSTSSVPRPAARPNTTSRRSWSPCPRGRARAWSPSAAPRPRPR